MTNKDLENIKRKEPFYVPENYFNTLSDQIMSNLPEKEIPDTTPVVSLWQKAKPLVYLAAMFIGAALIIRFLMPSKNNYTELASGLDIESVSDQFIQETIDGAMFDDYLMHVYLTEED